MICRYCGNAYAADDRNCQGCGAPKTGLVAQALDAPSTPEHWSNSFRKTVMRVLWITMAMLVLVTLLGSVGWQGLGVVLAIFWTMPVAPVLMSYAAWRTAKSDYMLLFVLLGATAMIWGGIFFASMIAVSLGVATFTP